MNKLKAHIIILLSNCNFSFLDLIFQMWLYKNNTTSETQVVYYQFSEHILIRYIVSLYTLNLITIPYPKRPSFHLTYNNNTITFLHSYCIAITVTELCVKQVRIFV